MTRERGEKRREDDDEEEEVVLGKGNTLLDPTDMEATLPVELELLEASARPVPGAVQKWMKPLWFLEPERRRLP